LLELVTLPSYELVEIIVEALAQAGHGEEAEKPEVYLEAMLVAEISTGGDERNRLDTGFWRGGCY
jgi:hypothetical protein